ncbi:MAG TPA: BON domain-containing protein [Pirellulales bacterium]|nr:BON domain-containing protein [Pirellulales bacterium]
MTMVTDDRSRSRMPKLQRERPDVARQNDIDRKIEQRVLRYLSFRGIVGLELVTLYVSKRNVVLGGIISSFSAKRRLCECCRSVAGVLNVSDRLVVLPSRWLGGQVGIRKPA